MKNEEEFVRALAASPGEVAVSLAFADWLEERGDLKAQFIRLWAKLWSSEYKEGSFEQIHMLAENYRNAAETLDRQWLIRVGRARQWVDRQLAITLVRVYLRMRHGRKEDRQWLGFQREYTSETWGMYFWRQNPALIKPSRVAFRKQTCLKVDKITGAIGELNFNKQSGYSWVTFRDDFLNPLVCNSL